MSEPKHAAAAPEAAEIRLPGEPGQVGRGALLLSGTKIYFILASYALYFGIDRAGGRDNPDLVGQYKAAGALLSILSTVLVSGTVQAISRFVARSPGSSRTIVRRAVKVQFLVGATLALAYAAAAPLIAQGRPELVSAMQVSAAIPLIYAVYAVFIGALNGERRFGEQAAVDATFTTLKLTLVLLGVGIFGTAAAGYAGFAIAAALVLIGAARIATGSGASRDQPDAAVPRLRDLLQFQAETLGFMVIIQWVVQMDLWYVIWLGGFSGDSAGAADALYAGAQLFAQIAYSLVIAITLVLFPLVAAAGNAGSETAKASVSTALRYAAILAMGAAVALTVQPRGSLLLLLSAAEELLEHHPDAGEALRWLGLGYVAFALFFILCAGFNAAGRARASLAAAAAVALIQLGLSAILVPRLGLVGQAAATAVAMLLGVLGMLLFVHRFAGWSFPAKTAVRILLAALVTYAAGLAIPEPGGNLDLDVIRVLNVLRILLTGTIFIGCLIVLRELDGRDLLRLRQVLRRSKP